MNYLELCQRLHLLLRAGEDRVGTAPLTVTGQSGLLYEITQWIAFANEDIQNENSNWLFMNASGDVLVPGRFADPKQVIGNYDELRPADDGHRRFILIAPEDANPSGNPSETPVFYIPWQIWTQGVLDRNDRGSGRPNRFTVTPDGQLEFNPIPDRNYIVRFNYRRSVQRLIDNEDQPIIPAKYHMAIVHRAIRDYYCLTRDSTGEFYQKADMAVRREMQKLANEQLPEVLT